MELTTVSGTKSNIQWLEPCVCCGNSVEAIPDKECREVFTWCEKCQMTGLSRFVEFTDDGGIAADFTRDVEWSGDCPIHHPDGTQAVSTS